MRQTVFRRLLYFIYLLLFSTSTNAQISITSSDILELIGTTQQLEFEDADNIVVDVGSAGENQEWSLMQVINERSTFDQIFLAPEDTRLSAEFPSANFAWSILGTNDEEIGEVELYEYFEVTPNTFSSLGGGVYSSQLDTSLLFQGVEDIAPLPLTYNTTWTATEIDTSISFLGFSLITLDTTINTVDGWGTLTIPSGSFECLRVRAETQCREITQQGGMVINEQTSSSIQYSWVSKDHLALAHVESQENETNLNFTNASVFERLEQSTTPALIITEPNLQLDHFPNPTRSTTTFSFYLSERDRITLLIYDAQGREVAVVANDIFNAGSHSLSWQNQMNPGVYVYKLKTGNQIQSKKLIIE